MRFKLVCFDSACILEPFDIWLKLHEIMETKDAAADLIKKYHGADERRFAQESLRMWKRHDAGAYLKLIKKVEFAKKSSEVVSALHKIGYKAAIIGEVPSQLGRRAKAELGLDLEFTNDITLENDCFTGYFDWFVTPQTKLTVLRDRLKERKLLLKDVIYITGDPDDLKIMKSVGVGVAFASSSVPLKEAANIIIRQRDLSAIPSEVEKLERSGTAADIFDK